MEPAVQSFELLGGAHDSSSSGSATASLFAADSSGSPNALAVLLGGEIAVAPFLVDTWEAAAWHCHPQQQSVQAQSPAQGQQQQQSVQAQPPTQEQQQQQRQPAEQQRGSMPHCLACSQREELCQQQQHDPTQQQQQHAAHAGSSSAAAEVSWLQLLSQELSIGRLFGQLLPAGLHCAVMGVQETDAVQVRSGVAALI
jgi:DNA mismatch repair ATPase MutL